MKGKSHQRRFLDLGDDGRATPPTPLSVTAHALVGVFV
jgi:hypothetical protein